VSEFEQGEIGPDPLSQGVRVWAGGSGFEASRSAVSRRQVQALDQGQEPETSRNGSDGGLVPL